MVAFAAVRLAATSSFSQFTNVCRRGVKSIVARVYGCSYRRAVEESAILINAVESNKVTVLAIMCAARFFSSHLPSYLQESGSFFRGKSNIMHAANIRKHRDIIDAVRAHDVALVQDFLWDSADCVNISNDKCAQLNRIACCC
jgi:hypothetical protein